MEGEESRGAQPHRAGRGAVAVLSLWLLRGLVEGRERDPPLALRGLVVSSMGKNLDTAPAGRRQGAPSCPPMASSPSHEHCTPMAPHGESGVMGCGATTTLPGTAHATAHRRREVLSTGRGGKPASGTPDRGVFAFSQSCHVGVFLNLIYNGKHKHYFLHGRLGSLWGLQSLSQTRHMAPVPFVP